MRPSTSEDTDRVEWDFGTGGLVDRTGHGLRLEPPPGAPPPEPVAGALRFDGATYLIIPADRVGPLHVARRGDRVSVLALVRRRGTRTGFVAGLWQEDDVDPRRQYGLFLSLPVYGGDQRVCGHVSADGRPSPGLPYSRDYAATARRLDVGRWQVAGFSYDGTVVRAYLDGETDDHAEYTEPGPPLGQGLTYAKNPYRYPLGLNRSHVSDFTVGAVRLTAGMGNHFVGDLARLLITPTALDPGTIRELSRAWLAERGDHEG